LLGLAVVFGEVPELPTVVARVSGGCELLWWPDCHLLPPWCSGGVVVLLLAVGTAGGYPRTMVEVGMAVPWVVCRPCSTSREHR
jgi:hypothetical protein